MSKKHMGSTIDDFLKEEGIFEEAQADAIKEVVAWQLAEAMKKQKISKNKMATLLKTSRTQVDRLLDPKNDITLSSLQRAAAMVGRRVSIELVQRREGLGLDFNRNTADPQVSNRDLGAPGQSRRGTELAPCTCRAVF
jgi:predicted XRE-type DNA-binding protein